MTTTLTTTDLPAAIILTLAKIECELPIVTTPLNKYDRELLYRRVAGLIKGHNSNYNVPLVLSGGIKTNLSILYLEKKIAEIIW